MRRYEPEQQRIDFVMRQSKEDRPEGPQQWAYNVMVAYRQAVLDKGRVSKSGVLVKHHATDPRFRRGFIESYLALKRFYLDSKSPPLSYALAQPVIRIEPMKPEELKKLEDWINNRQGM